MNVMSHQKVKNYPEPQTNIIDYSHNPLLSYKNLLYEFHNWPALSYYCSFSYYLAAL